MSIGEEILAGDCREQGPAWFIALTVDDCREGRGGRTISRANTIPWAVGR